MIIIIKDKDGAQQALHRFTTVSNLGHRRRGNIAEIFCNNQHIVDWNCIFAATSVDQDIAPIDALLRVVIGTEFFQNAEELCFLFTNPHAYLFIANVLSPANEDFVVNGFESLRFIEPPKTSWLCPLTSGFADTSQSLRTAGFAQIALGPILLLVVIWIALCLSTSWK